MAAWRDDARRLADENAELERRIAFAQAGLEDLRNDLRLQLYASAECHADQALRALDGRG